MELPPDTEVSKMSALAIVSALKASLDKLEQERDSLKAALDMEKREHERTTTKLSQLLQKRSGEETFQELVGLRKTVASLQFQLTAAHRPPVPSSQARVVLPARREHTPPERYQPRPPAPPVTATPCVGASAGKMGGDKSAAVLQQVSGVKRSLEMPSSGAPSGEARASGEAQHSPPRTAGAAAPSATPTAAQAVPAPAAAPASASFPGFPRFGPTATPTTAASRPPVRMPMGYAHGAINIVAPKRQRSLPLSA